MPKKQLGMTKRTAKKNEFEHDLKKYEVYLSERNRLLGLMTESNRSIDNAVLTLTAGAFGLSLTFIKTITPTINPKTLWILISSWICLGSSLCLTLFSFYTSKCASNKQINILEANYFPKEECNEETSKEQKEQGNSKNSWDIATKIFNFCSLIIFIAGITSITIFSAINIYNQPTPTTLNNKQNYQVTPAASVNKRITNQVSPTTSIKKHP